MNQHSNSGASSNAEPNNQRSPWIDDWLNTQRAWLSRWQSAATQSAAPAGIDMEMLRKQFNPGLSAEAMNVVQSFQTLLQSSLSQFGQGVAGAAPDAAWQQVLRSFAVGPLREQQTTWQEYTRALTEYELRQRAVFEQYGRVFSQSLDRVRAQAEQRNAQAQPFNNLRELYEAWIECGEQAFAQLAHDSAFMTSQAESANALSRLKLARNALFEYWLRDQDLPTRSELNSVHLRLRELSERVAGLEQALANANKPSSER